jgi:peptide/nickel transport system permease protein
LLQAIAICFGAATLTFLLLRLSPDPAAQFLPPNATADDIRIMRDAMGLNDPLYVVYFGECERPFRLKPNADFG